MNDVQLTSIATNLGLLPDEVCVIMDAGFIISSHINPQNNEPIVSIVKPIQSTTSNSTNIGGFDVTNEIVNLLKLIREQK